MRKGTQNSPIPDIQGQPANIIYNRCFRNSLYMINIRLNASKSDVHLSVITPFTSFAIQERRVNSLSSGGKGHKEQHYRRVQNVSRIYC